MALIIHSIGISHTSYALAWLAFALFSTACLFITLKWLMHCEKTPAYLFN